MKKWLIMLISVVSIILIIISVFAFIPIKIENKNVSGLQLRSQIWQKEIVILGDTYFAPWAKLTIMPDTKIKFEKKDDRNIENSGWSEWADEFIITHNDPTGKKGYKESHFFLSGKIIALGNKDAPITFTSAQEKKEYANWDEIVLGSGSHFDYVIIEYAHNGINLDGDNVIIENSIVHDSLWSCIDLYSGGNTIRKNEIYNCWHQGIGVKAKPDNLIENNYIHDAQLSVNCELDAKPTIRDNKFEGAPLNQDCDSPLVFNNEIVERIPNVSGGTYNGGIVYPSRE